MIEVKGLTKKYKGISAVDDISFKIQENSICGIIGPNGAGKTTILKSLVGYLKTDAGDIIINNEKVKFNKYPSDVQFLKDVPSFYDYLTAYEYLKMIADLNNLEEENVGIALKIVSLENTKKRIGTYSRGMRQRLGIAAAIISKPKVLILDEPISALDPIGRKEVFNLLKTLKKKMTILFSSHILDDIERICDSIIMINKGKVILSGSIKELEKKYFVPYLNIGFNTVGDFDYFLKNYKNLNNSIFTISREENNIKITCKNIKETQKEIIDFLSKNNLFVESLNISKMSLEEVFLKEVL